MGFMDLLIDHPDFITVDVEDDDKKTPLHHACANRDLELTVMLLDANANVNQLLPCGCTVLHHVIRDEHHAMAIVLLEYGASVNIPNDSEETPLHLAAEVDDIEMMDLLLIDGSGMRPIDFTATNDRNQTYLHLAVGSEDMVETLLEAGAVPDEHALRYAAMCGELMCFDMMMDRWPRGKEVDIDAMAVAAHTAGHQDVAKAILEWVT
jgi:ankyrin repeat protein